LATPSGTPRWPLGQAERAGTGSTTVSQAASFRPKALRVNFALVQPPLEERVGRRR
jgi:hypothetical protein